MMSSCVIVSALWGARLNFVCGWVEEGVSRCIWAGTLSKADRPPKWAWTSPTLLKVWKQKVEENEFVSFPPPSHCLNWDPSFHLLLHLDLDLYHQLPWLPGLRLRLHYSTSFSGQRIMGLVNLHNCISQCLIIIHSFHCSVSSENPDQCTE